MQNKFDLIVIGGGPGGYVAAIRAAQLGFKVALFEKTKYLGGTCLNIGCIPSKALLHSTYEYERLNALAGKEVADKSMPLEKIHQHREQTLKALRGGVQMLVSKRGVEIIHAHATLKGDGNVEADGKIYSADKILLATGSKVATLPSLPLNGESVVSSTEVLEFHKIPSKMVVVGGGAIGLELGQVWSRLGTQVTVLEFLPQIAPGFDSDVAEVLEKSLSKRGMKIHTDTRVEGIINGQVQASKEGEPLRFEAEKVLVAVGRIPNTDGLGLDEAGVTLTNRGRVQVDENFATTAEGVYAIGDLIDGPMLAHKAEEEGVAFAESLKSGHVHCDRNLIPAVVYTDPEVAIVGQTQRVLTDKNIPFKVGKFSYTANGRALASHSSEGFVKVIAHAETDRVLGVQIIGQGASELIAAATAHMAYGGSAEDIARTCHAHPTLAEAMKEAALAVDKRSINSL